MGCLDANVVQQFIAGGLAPGERADVEEHLRSCEPCTHLVSALSPDDSRSATEQASPRSRARVSTVRPRMVERYEIAEPLGEGGMGIVYAAYDPELHREVALKLLRSTARAAGDTAGARARLLREAQAMARIAHPNVIAVYDVGVWEGQVFVAMELAPKGTLRKWQNVPGRAWRDIVDAYLAAGRGLVAAHAAGLVHRDFKPDNVLVGADGRMRVTDFGLARAENTPPESADAAAASGMLEVSLTMTGAVMGTPAYMAPEQIDRETTDARSDQFSFCVAMWEALYGRRPFVGATLADVREAIERHAVSVPKSEVALPIQRGLLRGLAARPENRWPSMADLLDALAPRRSPRKGIAIGLTAAVLVGGAVSAAGTWLGRRNAASCEPPTVPASLWPARRIAVAAQVPDTVVRRVDGWFEAWNAAAATTCTTDRDKAALRTRRARCLMTMFDDVDVLLAHWERGQGVGPLEAHTAFEDLPLATRCSAAAQRSMSAPKPGQVVPVRALELAFAHAHGNGPELQMLIAEAHAVGYVPLEVAIALELAAVQYQTDHEAAARTMREAVTIADREPAEVPRIVARLRLFEILAADHPDETSAIADAVRRLIIQLGGDAELQGTLEYLVGEAQGSRDRPDEAVAAYEHARSEFQIAYGPDSQHEVSALVGLAGAHSMQHHKGTNTEVRNARDAALAINKRTGVFLPFLGIMGEMGDLKKLIAVSEEGLAWARTQKSGEALVHADFNAATAYFLDDQWEPSLAHYQASAKGAERLGMRDSQLADALCRIATLLAEHGRAGEAAPFARRAIEVSVAIGDETDHAFGFVALGLAQIATGDVAPGRESLEQALTIFETIHAPPEHRVQARFPLAKATWAVDRTRALDLAHAAREDARRGIDAISPDDPYGPSTRRRQQKRLDDITSWLATHH